MELRQLTCRRLDPEKTQRSMRKSPTNPTVPDLHSLTPLAKRHAHGTETRLRKIPIFFHLTPLDFARKGRSEAEPWVDHPPNHQSPNGARFHFAHCTNAPQESRPVGPCACSFPQPQGCAGSAGSALGFRISPPLGLPRAEPEQKHAMSPRAKYLNNRRFYPG